MDLLSVLAAIGGALVVLFTSIGIAASYVFGRIGVDYVREHYIAPRRALFQKPLRDNLRELER